jgi:hypothetical protein
MIRYQSSGNPMVQRKDDELPRADWAYSALPYEFKVRSYKNRLVDWSSSLSSDGLHSWVLVP